MEILKIVAPFPLENGQNLSELEIAYCVYGELNQKKDNVIWISHGLTGNADAADWWSGLVGEGKLFDPAKHFIICSNMLGSCYGTTGPASINPSTKEAYGAEFPLITIRDMVKANIQLKEYLDIDRIHCGIGASMGGQLITEWAINQPSVFEHICVIAANAQHSPWGIAFNEAQRMAIETGLKSGIPESEAVNLGLETARAIAMLSYRHYSTYKASQMEEQNDKIDNFKASSYQRYQGQKLRKRFNVYSYLRLSKAMDSHNVGRNRGGVEQALANIQARALVIGIQSDILFPVEEQQRLAKGIPDAKLEIINSQYGHDGFLVENDRITKVLAAFLTKRKWRKYNNYQLNNNNLAFLTPGRVSLPGTESF